jgi:hypothetical protein
MCTEDLKEGLKLLKEGVGHCNALLQSTSISPKDAQVALKSRAYANMAIGSKVDRIGE